MLTLFLMFLLPFLILYWSFYKPLKETLYKVKNIPTVFFYGVTNKRHNLYELLQEQGRIHKRFFKIWLAHKLLVFIYKPEDVEVVLKSTDTKKAYKLLEFWLGKQSFLLKDYGKEFLREKKYFLKAFHTERLEGYLDVLNRNAAKFCDDLKGLVGHEFDVEQKLNHLSMKTILMTICGLDSENLPISDQEINTYVHSEERMMFLSVLKRTSKLWLIPDIIFKFSSIKKSCDNLKRILDKISTHIIEEIFTSGSNTLFLDIAENIPTLSSKEDLRDLVTNLLLAGQDTTSSALGFLLCLLGSHQDIQEKVHEEIISNFGKDAAITRLRDVKKLEYTDRVVKELLRLFPVVFLIARIALKDIYLSDGQILPKDSVITIPITLVHRNSEWKNPEKFDPDNFLPENINSKHRYSYIPFSANHRTCIGGSFAILVMKIFLVTFLRRYKIHSRIPHEDFKIKIGITIKRKDGFLINLENRP